MSLSSFAATLLYASALTAPDAAPTPVVAVPVAAPAMDSGEVSPGTPIAAPAPVLRLPVLPIASVAPANTPAPSSPPNDADEIIVRARPRPPREDPLQAVNKVSFEAVQIVDKAVVGPAASGYKKVVPKPIRNGLRNAIDNLREPIIFVNFFLQLKPLSAVKSVGRFVINSTIGVAGLFDMAKRKPFNLPMRKNGFAYTLGYYGVKQGPFLFVPVIGPTTVRDLIGRVLDLSLVPAVVGKPLNDPLFALVSGTLRSIDDRNAFDDELRRQRAAVDPYAESRAFYLQTRQAEIDALRGKKPEQPKPLILPVLPGPAPAADAVSPAATAPTAGPAGAEPPVTVQPVPAPVQPEAAPATAQTPPPT